MKLRKVKKNFLITKIQGLSQNWCSFSPDGLVTPSIEILTKRIYSVVHYLSNKQLWTSVYQIGSRVTADFVKIVACTPSKTGKKLTKTQIYLLTSSSPSEAVHLTFSFSKYCPFTAKHASILSTYFYGDFKLLQKVSQDHLGFPDHLGICFQVPYSSHFNSGNNQNLESPFQQGDRSTFNFLNLTQNFTG